MRDLGSLWRLTSNRLMKTLTAAMTVDNRKIVVTAAVVVLLAAIIFITAPLNYTPQ